MTRDVEPKKDEVSIRAKASASGLDVAAQSRLISGLDFLCGNFFGIPSALLARFRRSIERTDELVEIQHEAKKKNLEDDYASLLNTLTTEREVRKIENRLNVAVCIEKFISEKEEIILPGREVSYEGNLDGDWLEIFISHCEQAKSERLRTMLGRVLLAQAIKPKAISPTALRILAECDQEIIGKFLEIAKFRLNHDNAIPFPRLYSHQAFSDLIDMQELGLISGVGSNIVTDVTESIKEGEIFFIGNSGVVLDQMLRSCLSRIPVIVVTRAGCEIAALLPPHTDDIVLRNCIRFSIFIEKISIIRKNEEGQFLASVENISPLMAIRSLTELLEHRTDNADSV